MEALLEGKLDVAIVTQSVRHDQVRVRPLFEDEHAAIVAPDHPFAKRAFVRPAGSCRGAAAPLLELAGRQLHDSAILRPAGVVPQRVSFVMLTEAILEMVKARLGISVMQTWAIEPALRAGDVRAIPITAAGIRRQWSAATLEGRRPRRSRRRVHRSAGPPRDAGSPASAACAAGLEREERDSFVWITLDVRTLFYRTYFFLSSSNQFSTTSIRLWPAAESVRLAPVSPRNLPLGIVS